MGRRVKRTRNLETWTESQYWGRIRSSLRRMSMYWKPLNEAKKRARKSVKGKRHKYEYQCAMCNNWFKSNEVQVDHIIEAGSLKSSDDLKGFVDRLFCEDVDGFQVLCKNKKVNGKIVKHGCHHNKTHNPQKK